MIKTKNIVLGLGLVAGLGITAFAVDSHAALAENQGTATVTVNIGSKITLAVENGNISISDVDSSKVFESTDKTTVKVTSNTAKYKLEVQDNSGDGSLVHTSVGTNKIAALGDAETLTAGTSRWGIKVNDTGSYIGVPANGNPKKIAGKTDGAVVNDATTIQYGVAISPDQAYGTYQATILFTASEES